MHLAAEKTLTMYFASRMGLYLLILSLITLVIFYASVVEGSPSIAILCIGLSGFLVSAIVIWRARKPPADSGRFRILRSAPKKRPRK